MTSERRSALAGGVCYLITHVTSVTALVLYQPVLNDPGYVTGHGAGTRVLLGGWLEVVLALAVAGTAVALFPVVRRHSETLAIGYVSLRTLEAAVIAAGVVSLLAVVTLRQPGATGADAAALGAVGKGLVAVHNWAFLLGPSFVCAADTTVLAVLMWRSRLIPRFIAGLGVAGGPMLFAASTLELFGAFKQVSPPASVAPVVVFAWELGLALFLIIKGFRATSPGHPAPRVTKTPAFAA